MSPWGYLCGVAVLLTAVSIATVRSGLLLRVWAPPQNLLLGVGDNVMRLVLVAVSLGWGILAGPGAGALGWRTAHLGRDVITGVVVGLALALVVNAAGRAAVRHWGSQVFSSRMIRFMIPANGREWAGVLLALLPAAALEELLFRSLPLGGLGWLLSPWWLLWPLALVFGFLHWPQGGWGVVGTVFSGVVLSLLFLATHSIWAPIIAHYVMNVHQLLSARASGTLSLRNPPTG